MKTLNLKIIIRLRDGKQQQFTISGSIQNPDIDIEIVSFDIERAINVNTEYRAHVELLEE
jgi:hypothetical protein